MFSITINPRFSDTDALGHINNTVLPVWFEEGRTPIFRLFVPDLDPKKWCLIIAGISVSFSAQLFYGKPITINTFLKHVGTSSMTIGHEAWQNNGLAAQGEASLIHYSYQENRPIPIPDSIKSHLLEHLIPQEQ
jgi:acyl-CoA thioester hydrolase